MRVFGDRYFTMLNKNGLAVGWTVNRMTKLCKWCASMKNWFVDSVWRGCWIIDATVWRLLKNSLTQENGQHKKLCNHRWLSRCRFLSIFRWIFDQFSNRKPIPQYVLKKLRHREINEHFSTKTKNQKQMQLLQFDSSMISGGAFINPFRSGDLTSLKLIWWQQARSAINNAWSIWKYGSSVWINRANWATDENAL